jgi:hypothetical protein
MKKFIYILFSLSILISSCESDAEVEIPFEPVKLVLSTFLDPDADTNFVYLSKSDPVFDQNSSYFNDLLIDDGIVKITDGTQEITLRYDNVVEAYYFRKNEFDIDFNKSYNISASTINQTINVSVKTVDSNSISINDVSIDSITKDDGFGGSSKTYKIRFNFNDPATEENYYRISITPTYIYFDGSFKEYEYVTNDIYSDVIISDAGKNGTAINIYNEYSSFNFGFESFNYVAFKIYVTKIDADSYKYFKSLQNYTGEDPFSEPTLIYTNVPNGLGIVGSKQVFSYRKAL